MIFVTKNDIFFLNKKNWVLGQELFKWCKKEKRLPNIEKHYWTSQNHS